MKVKLEEAHLHRGGITPCEVNYSLQKALVLKQFQITQFHQLLYVLLLLIQFHAAIV